MRSHSTFGLILFFVLLCAMVEVKSQQTYDGRNGPHIIGPPGHQVYIRGQNEGVYTVPGVEGVFENSRGKHIYSDQYGTTFENSQGKHSIHGPSNLQPQQRTSNIQSSQLNYEESRNLRRRSRREGQAIEDFYLRPRRATSGARVIGSNFAAREDQAGIWNDSGVSVWTRPDGRTVTIDANGNIITSGSPNGRGPQYYG